jgi:hypothetical protein
MRFSTPLMAAFAASASATAPMERTTMFTLEVAPGETIEVTEEEKFKMIDVSYSLQRCSAHELCCSSPIDLDLIAKWYEIL